jgi:hypothetical protein
MKYNDRKNVLTNYMKEKVCNKHNSRSSGPDILRISWYLDVHYHINNSSSLKHILNRVNSICFVTSYSVEDTKVNIILFFYANIYAKATQRCHVRYVQCPSWEVNNENVEIREYGTRRKFDRNNNKDEKTKQFCSNEENETK